MNEYIIEVCDIEGDNNWKDCKEGPFDTFEMALSYAENEVGYPWRIVLRVIILYQVD
jgi:hypothetical protein